MMIIWKKVRNRTVRGKYSRLVLEEELVYLGAGGEAGVVLVLMEASVVGLRGYPELHSWLKVQEDHLNESSSRFLGPENRSLL